MTLRTESPYRLVPAPEALALILARVPTLPAETTPREQAYGRVLAEDVASPEDQPAAPVSSVDGYAVVGADESSERQVLGELTAGLVGEQVTVGPGAATRIMTGAPLPPGADAVVMVEDTQEVAGRVTIRRLPQPGDNVLPRALDLTKGQVVLAAGTPLGGAEIGLLATIGRATIRTVRQPVVAALSTGDELVEPETSPLPLGAVRDSNRYALLAAIREAGGIPISLGRVKDVAAEQEALIREGLARADVVLTSGGVSMGTRDLIKPILERLGTVHFGRIAFRPGKPLTFASVGAPASGSEGQEKFVFGLPGFPVSSLVTFEVFVRPALRQLQGYRHVHRPRVQVVVEHALRRTRDRTEYQRAVVRWRDGRLVATSTGHQGSSRLLSMVGANALLHIAPGEGTVAPGETIDALLIGEILNEA